MLEVIALKKTFADFMLNVSFSVADDEILVLSGPSGSGKTTTLNLIAGLLPPDSGEIIISGRDITALPPWERNVSLVFQDLSLFPHLDVAGNIEFSLKIKKVPKAKREQTVKETLRLVRLENYGRRKIQTLSGGEKQRVAIARSLASKPDLLLFDEVFSNLDEALISQLSDEFLEIKKITKIPWVFVTHNKKAAEVLADKTYTIGGNGLRPLTQGNEMFYNIKSME